MRMTESRKIALCGVLGALSIVLLLIGAVLQIGTYAAPMLATFLLVPVLEDCGPRYALLLYGTVGILSLILVPETELALFYTLVLGYYPALRAALGKIRWVPLRWAAKLAVFNAGTLLVYLVLFALVGPALLSDGMPLAVAMLAVGNLAFCLYDRALANITRVYRLKLRGKLNKLLYR